MLVLIIILIVVVTIASIVALNYGKIVSTVDKVEDKVVDVADKTEKFLDEAETKTTGEVKQVFEQAKKDVDKVKQAATRKKASKK